MALHGYGGLMSDPDTLRQRYHSEAPPRGTPRHGYANDEVDKLAEAQLTATDPDERREIVADLQREIAEDLPVLSTYVPTRYLFYDEATFDGWYYTPGCSPCRGGMQAAAIALREIGQHSKDEEVVAVVETDMCGVHAIQVMTGCTFGKGNLIPPRLGQERLHVLSPLRATDADRERLRALHQSQARAVLELNPDDLYGIQRVETEPPARARIHAAVPCAECDEGTMETRIRRLDGRELCPPCFDIAVANR